MEGRERLWGQDREEIRSELSIPSIWKSDPFQCITECPLARVGYVSSISSEMQREEYVIVVFWIVFWSKVEGNIGEKQQYGSE